MEWYFCHRKMVEVDKLVSFLAGMCGTSGCLVGRPNPKKELLYLVGCCLDFDIRYENKFLKWGGKPTTFPHLIFSLFEWVQDIESRTRDDILFGGQKIQEMKKQSDTLAPARCFCPFQSSSGHWPRKSQCKLHPSSLKN